MALIAIKNLFEERGRLAIACGGVAFAAMLILVLWGISQGTVRQAGAYVRGTDADAWVVQSGFTDIAHGFSVLPERLGRRLERIEGVRDANPVVAVARELRVDGEKHTLLLVGYDRRTGVGGPWAWPGQEHHPGEGEVALDATFADVAGLEVGDELPLPEGERTIVALTEETSAVASWMGFAPLEDVRKLSQLEDSVNFYALRIEDGREQEVLAAVEEQVRSATVFDRETFISNNEREMREGVQPVLYVMVAVSFLVGLAVVGLTIFTATMEKSREYGVLAAIGADRGALSRVVVVQSSIVSSIGFLAGAVLVAPAAWAIRSLTPRVEFAFEPLVFPLVGLAALVMAVLAAYVPVRRLAKLDPAEVFRA